MHNEHIDYYEIIEKVDEIYTKMLPVYLCDRCGSQYLYIANNDQGDFVVYTLDDPKNRITKNCDLHINFDLFFNPTIGQRVIIPKGYETLTGQRVFLPEPFFARIWLSDRLN